jgi:hypothetical protein
MSKSVRCPAVRKHEFEEITKKLDRITPERQRIANVFKTHVEAAVDELGPGYTVDLQGSFDTTPIRIIIEVSSNSIGQNRL